MKIRPLSTFLKLCQFLGYGSPDAKLWFIGLEERLDIANSREIGDQIRKRLTFEPVEDLRDALEKLEIDEYHNCDKSNVQRTWKWMCLIMLRLDGADIGTSRDKKTQHCYQVHRLGRTMGETFMAELLPLPKKSELDWPPVYKKLFQFKTVNEYREGTLKVRTALLRNLMTTHKPRVVICYSKSSWRDFEKELFEDVDFKQDDKNEKIRRGVTNGVLVLLTPQFGQAMSFECAERMIQIVAEHCPPTFPKAISPITRLAPQQLRQAANIQEEILALQKKLNQFAA